jgi:hypothetical protein
MFASMMSFIGTSAVVLLVVSIAMVMGVAALTRRDVAKDVLAAAAPEPKGSADRAAVREGFRDAPADYDVSKTVDVMAAYKEVFGIDPGANEIKRVYDEMALRGETLDKESAVSYLRKKSGKGPPPSPAASGAGGGGGGGGGARDSEFLRAVEDDLEKAINAMDKVLDRIHSRVASTSGRDGGPGALLTDRPLPPLAPASSPAASEELGGGDSERGDQGAPSSSLADPGDEIEGFVF